MSDVAYRPAHLNVDLDAILYDYNIFKTLQSDKLAIPVIKADGYGSGNVKIAETLENNGAQFFAVATLGEAIELRLHNINAKLLVLGAISPKDINKAIQYDITLTVPLQFWLERTTHYIEDNSDHVYLHVKLDTGMGRLEIKALEEYQLVINLIKEHPALIFDGVFTHLADADEPGDSIKQQYTFSEELVAKAERPKYTHAQNLAGALSANCKLYNALRLRISLYGYYPSEYVRNEVDVQLKPSARLMTRVVQTKYLDPGDSVSCGSTSTATEKMKIAVLPIGYTDDFLRAMQGFAVNVNQYRCEVIGRVCMDQMIINVPDDVKEGNEVILIDNNLNSSQAVETSAIKQNTINYEVLCNLGHRLPRIYYLNKKFEVTNELLN